MITMHAVIYAGVCLLLWVAGFTFGLEVGKKRRRPPESPECPDCGSLWFEVYPLDRALLECNHCMKTYAAPWGRLAESE